MCPGDDTRQCIIIISVFSNFKHKQSTGYDNLDIVTVKKVISNVVVHTYT